MKNSESHAPATLLSLANVCKGFTGVQALTKVDFELAAGEIHALLGENGAGKSTLIKVMTGVYARDSGSVSMLGKDIAPRSPAEALAEGISTVYQEVNLLPNLSVAHNLFLGREPKKFGFIQWKQINTAATSLLRRFHLDIDVTRPLATFSIAVQQLVAIARGIDLSARVLILDEPTASLDQAEAELLFHILRDLKAQGIGIIFITHFLDQVYAIADRITVLRNGQKVGTFAADSLPRAALIAHMLGRELQTLEQQSVARTGLDAASPALEVRDLSADNGIRAVSFSTTSGQAVGLSGLLGSGRTELCEALFGLARRSGGSITLEGRQLEHSTPRAAIRHGFAMCPEDRKAEGIVAPLSIRENIILALQAKRGWLRPIPAAEQTRLVEQAIRDLNIICPHAEKPVEELSGGNQQKVILARWLVTSPTILILDEPTRGIDIGAHAEIIRLIRRLRERGLTVIVASSEFEELLAFSDKILVMREHALIAELTGSELSEQHLMSAIARVH